MHDISKKSLLKHSLGALERVRPFVSMHTAVKIYKGPSKPHFDYCSAVWDARGGTFGISGWGCAAGTLEPLTYTRASLAEFCYPILE